jgi:hypothetical protein
VAHLVADYEDILVILLRVGGNLDLAKAVRKGRNQLLLFSIGRREKSELNSPDDSVIFSVIKVSRRGRMSRTWRVTGHWKLKDHKPAKVQPEKQNK